MISARTFPITTIVPRSILVFRALQVGDMLCAVPALRALRRHFPDAHIVLAGLPWAHWFARRFDAYIDEFIAFPGHPDLPESPADLGRFDDFLLCAQSLHADLALQLHGSGEVSNAIVARCGARFFAGFARSVQHTSQGAHYFPYPERGHESRRLLALVQSLGAEPQRDALEFPVRGEDIEELAASGFGRLTSSGNYVCLHAGARDRSKCWPAECFSAVADQLSRVFGLQVVLTGSAAEHALASDIAMRMRQPAINAASNLSLGALGALVKHARLLICNDTAVSHMADAMGLPSVVIFTRDHLDRWAPQDRQRHRCVLDAAGLRVSEVLAQARSLLHADHAR